MVQTEQNIEEEEKEIGEEPGDRLLDSDSSYITDEEDSDF